MFQSESIKERLESLEKSLEHLDMRITWIERLLMTEGRELFSSTATHVSNWSSKDV